MSTNWRWFKCLQLSHFENQDIGLTEKMNRIETLLLPMVVTQLSQHPQNPPFDFIVPRQFAVVSLAPQSTLSHAFGGHTIRASVDTHRVQTVARIINIFWNRSVLDNILKSKAAHVWFYTHFLSIKDKPLRHVKSPDAQIIFTNLNRIVQCHMINSPSACFVWKQNNNLST